MVAAPSTHPDPTPPLEALYSQHHRWLCGWLRQRLGCAHSAADVAQDTFLRLLAARDALCSLHEPRAFLATTARRLLIDRARRQQLEREYLCALQQLQPGAAAATSPEETLAALQALAQVDALLAQAPPKARAAFLMHYLDERPHAEIAQALGVSTRMVGKYLVQVLRECRPVYAPAAG